MTVVSRWAVSVVAPRFDLEDVLPLFLIRDMVGAAASGAPTQPAKPPLPLPAQLHCCR